jgi:phosphatidylinositol alpha 1,6-mannosyltransferase
VSAAPRVAFFPDSFGEVNGVAHTSRHLMAFAVERHLPFLCVHAGPTSRTVRVTPSVVRVELERGRMSFGLERDLRFDLGLWRHTGTVKAEVEAFGADLIHVTGPNDVGQLGAFLAHAMGIPLVASWHTNLHDFAARRLERLLRWMPSRARPSAAAQARRHALALVLDFYKLADILLAPNPELQALLSEATGRPVHLMERGVDTSLFSPRQRNRITDVFRIGYVGRLSAEKNVRQFAALEAKLIEHGAPPFCFIIIGDGHDRAWLHAHLHYAEFPGVLTGRALAAAYANMDAFVFPSETDTFGNVVLEALASGTPAIVTPSGGPKYLVRDGLTGFVVDGTEGFCRATLDLMRDPVRLSAMRIHARSRALEVAWPDVFEGLYQTYAEGLSLLGTADCVVRHDPDTLTPAARLIRRVVAHIIRRMRRRAAAGRRPQRARWAATGLRGSGPGLEVDGLLNTRPLQPGEGLQ